MRSTFHTLETARRALFTQQSALQTTGHNIANANTPGYSRQRVNFSQTEPYPAPAMNRPLIPGQIGTGVEAGTIQRVRDSFLDLQYRGESTKLGYWSARSEALGKMENIMNEPSENGLSKTLDRFWQSLQDLASNPENSGARSVVRQRGVAVAETFHYLSDSLKSVKSDINTQINVTVKEINSIARQINSLNEQIAGVEPHGYLANDLYDKRDLLVDQLSQLANLKVTRVGSGGQSLDIAEGRYTIEIVSKSGESFTLVDGENLRAHEISVSEDAATGQIVLNELNGSVSGKLQGLIESHNDLYTNMLNDLDKMAYEFAKAFNEQHKAGYGLNDSQGNHLFFAQLTSAEGAASNIAVADAIMADGGQKLIAASAVSTAPVNRNGNGENALALADVIYAPIDTDGDGTNDFEIKDFYNGMIGSMAVSAQEANRHAENSGVLLQSAEMRRQSVSGVSLDEEMTNLIQYQHAYNAAARMVTAVDEMLNRIINRMGV